MPAARQVGRPPGTCARDVRQGCAPGQGRPPPAAVLPGRH